MGFGRALFSAVTAPLWQHPPTYFPRSLPLIRLACCLQLSPDLIECQGFNFTITDFYFEIGIIHTMLFEYDPHKSEGNRQKHGISFKEAQALWNDNSLIRIPARNLDEPRTLVVGKISDKHWSAVITYRGDKIRIISVRRSRKEEIVLYENESISFR
jgi:uncharacterized protein